MGATLTPSGIAAPRVADRPPVRVPADQKFGPPYVPPAAPVPVAADRKVGQSLVRQMLPSLSHALRSGVAWGIVVSLGLAVWVLASMDGFAYYLTPVKVRGYVAAHAVLRPSAPVGQMFGVIGTVFMLVPFLYMARKRSRGKGVGTTRGWLEVHLFCGIVGPVLVTFHTAFKFNGFVSAAYWSMMAVMLSGFVGRYLYVRIPRSIRGTEFTRAELDSRADALHLELLTTAGGTLLLDKIGRLERAAAPADTRLSWIGLLFGEFGVRRKLTSLAHDVRRSAFPPAQQEVLIQVATERVLLLRRVAYLQRTKSAFGLWHVFHLPLVYLMLAITVLHVGVVLYLGYVPFRW
jgi:hypothetical protein